MKLFEWLKRLILNSRKSQLDLKRKETLPEEFDVFFANDFIDPFLDLRVPGNVYAAGTLDVGILCVDGDIIIEGNVNCCDITVGGSFISKGFVDCLDVNVDGLFDCWDVESWFSPIKAADFVCRRYEEENQ